MSNTLLPELSARSQRPVHPDFGAIEPATLEQTLEDPEPEPEPPDPIMEIRMELADIRGWQREHELKHQIHEQTHSLHGIDHQLEAKK